MDNKERVNEMENILNWIKGAAAAIGGIAAYIWGGWDPLIIVLVAMVSIDYITGVINAGLQHGLSSQVGFKGLLKKIVIFMIVAVGTLIDRIIPATNAAVRTAVCMYYIANEGLSILENAAEMGLPLPSALKKVLGQIRREDESAAADAE